MIDKFIKIESYDVQPNSIVKPSALQKYMQQLAREDMLQYGTTYYGMREYNQVFVIVKLAIKFLDNIMAEQVINIRTWQKQVRGATFIREFEIKRDDEVVALCSTHWVLLDFEKRAIIKPDKIKGHCDSFPEHSTGIIPERRIISPRDELISISDYEVTYCDLDENMHLNNAVYADIAMNNAPFFSEDKKMHPPIEFMQINFAGEVKHRDNLKISAAEIDNGYRTRIENAADGKVCAEAEFLFFKEDLG